MSPLVALVEHVDDFQAKIVRAAVIDAEAETWRRRAAMLRWAQPRPGDFTGRATREELSARWRRLEDEAQACENRARVALLGGEDW